MKNYIYPETTVMPAYPFSFLMASPGGKGPSNIPQPGNQTDDM